MKAIIIRLEMEDEEYALYRTRYKLSEIKDCIKQAGLAELSMLFQQHEEDDALSERMKNERT